MYTWNDMNEKQQAPHHVTAACRRGRKEEPHYRRLFATRERRTMPPERGSNQLKTQRTLFDVRSSRSSLFVVGERGSNQLKTRRMLCTIGSSQNSLFTVGERATTLSKRGTTPSLFCQIFPPIPVRKKWKQAAVTERGTWGTVAGGERSYEEQGKTLCTGPIFF